MLSVDKVVIDNWVGPYAFLRNDHFCDIEVREGTRSYGLFVFPSLEHAYQASKTDNLDAKRDIEEASTASEAKAIGRGLLLPEGWGNRRFAVMRDLVNKKFRQNKDLGQQLVATGDATLVMRSERDSFWGQNSAGQGKNMLGVILMEVRRELAEESRYNFATPPGLQQITFLKSDPSDFFKSAPLPGISDDYLSKLSPSHVAVGKPDPLAKNFRSSGDGPRQPSLVDVARKVVDAFGKGNSSYLASVVVTKIENNPDEYADLIKELAEAIKNK